MKRILSVLVALLLMASALRAEEPPGDASGQANVQPLTWEPMIVELYAATSHGGSSVVKPPSKEVARANDVYGEAAQWVVLKPQIVPRKDAYPADVNVLSAWQRTVSSDGKVEFIRYGTGPAGAGSTGIHTIFCDDAIVRISVDVDILMNRTPDQRDQIVKDHFKLAEFSITAVKVSDDPAAFRDAVPENAMIYNVDTVKVGSPEAATGDDFRNHRIWTGANAPSWDTHNAGPLGGVYEFRVKARVLGRADSQVEYVSRTVEGAIRIATIRQKIGEITILNFDGMRKPGEKDLIKNGLLGGTTQDPQKPRK